MASACSNCKSNWRHCILRQRNFIVNFHIRRNDFAFLENAKSVVCDLVLHLRCSIAVIWLPSSGGW